MKQYHSEIPPPDDQRLPVFFSFETTPQLIFLKLVHHHELDHYMLQIPDPGSQGLCVLAGRVGVEWPHSAARSLPVGSGRVTGATLSTQYSGCRLNRGGALLYLNRTAGSRA